MENFTDAFINWVRQNQNRLKADGITLEMPDEVAGNGTHASFFTKEGKEKREVMVEIWDYGFSEFYVTDPRSEQVQVTHYEFQETAELYAALDQLINRLSLVSA